MNEIKKKGRGKLQREEGRNVRGDAMIERHGGRTAIWNYIVSGAHEKSQSTPSAEMQNSRLAKKYTIGIDRNDVKQARRSISQAKSMVRKQNKKVRSPKPRCGNFFMQTYCDSTYISIVFEHLDRGISIDRIGVEKATFDFLKEQRRASKTSLGPRKSRCVDFLRHTYCNAV